MGEALPAGPWRFCWPALGQSSFYPMTESLFLALSASFFWRWKGAGRPPPAGWACWPPCAQPGALLAGRQRRGTSCAGGGKAPPASCAVAGGSPGPGSGNVSFAELEGVWKLVSVCRVSKEHWHQGPGFFTDTVRYHLDYFASWWAGKPGGALFISLAAVCTILCSLALLTLTAKKAGGASPGIWAGLFGFYHGGDLAAQRAPLCRGPVPLPAALALTARRRGARWLVLAVLAVLGAVYTAEFIRHGPIY